MLGDVDIKRCDPIFITPLLYMIVDLVEIMQFTVLFGPFYILICSLDLFIPNLEVSVFVAIILHNFRISIRINNSVAKSFRVSTRINNGLNSLHFKRLFRLIVLLLLPPTSSSAFSHIVIIFQVHDFFAKEKIKVVLPSFF